ncbi:MAG: regulatory protein RecX [Magnetococcales bacterium]|nr:regulatory protein RecX [Magnetococcales bacterium]
MNGDDLHPRRRDRERAPENDTRDSRRGDGYELALRLLTGRPYGQIELARRLEREGIGPEAIETTLARCRDLGYLDDRAFAASRARVRRARGWGPLRIRAELKSLGVEAEWIEAALANPEEEEAQDPVEEARRVLEKRFGAQPALDWRDRQKRYAFLLRRGFEPEVIAAALNPMTI